MRQSQLHSRLGREVGKEEVSINAQLLSRGGFVDRLMAGAYSFLPLGTRVLWKIEDIIRDEMSRVGSQEVFLPALHPRENWDKTNRWDSMDVLFRLKGAGDRDFCLGPTHEEVVTPLIGQIVNSYKDLPMSVYQIQTKFRNEARAKSGVLRGREFRMKDLYSFHTTLEDLDQYYDKVLEAYHRVFARCGLGSCTYLTFASGGAFSKFSHEFQTITPYGEDHIYLCKEKNVAINKEIYEEIKDQPEWKGLSFTEEKAIEVGNIFKLGTRFSDAFALGFQDSSGKKCPVYMGCYGIGSTRVLGTVVEVLSDDKGIIWPKEIAPFDVHLISLDRNESEKQEAEKMYSALQTAGFDVLFDDRQASAGDKFANSDLIGIPMRVVISARTLANQSAEVKARTDKEGRQVKLADVLNSIGR